MEVPNPSGVTFTCSSYRYIPVVTKVTVEMKSEQPLMPSCNCKVEGRMTVCHRIWVEIPIKIKPRAVHRT